jgi:UDP-glucose 4-epimerase
MRILVTGGAGFIGSHIATRLVEQGEQVRVLDNFANSARENLDHIIKDIELVEGDLRSIEDVGRAVDGIELIYHEGALGSVPRSIADPHTSFDVNVMGTLNVLNAAREAGVRRVVYASSSSVYGNTPVLPKQEDMRPMPISPYAVSKLSAEQLCGAFYLTYGLETVSLRYFNVFGPRQNPDSQYAAVMPKFLRAYTAGQQPTIFGDGGQSRSFTYIDNVVDGNLLAGSVPEAAGRMMNLASDKKYSVKYIARKMAALLNVEFNPTYEPPRQGDVRDSLADITIAREVLGWEPAVSLEDGLARTVRAFVETHAVTAPIAAQE